MQRHLCDIAALVLCLVTCAPVAARAGVPDRNALVAPGTFAVGFEARIDLDVSRAYADGFSVQGRGARPVLMAIWYPATRQARLTPLRQGDYLDPKGFPSAERHFAERVATVGRDVIAQEVTGARESWMDEAQAAVLARYLAAPTTAVRGARRAPGRFPLVIYHPGLGGTFADTAPLLEFLASHGYVVVASAFHPMEPHSLRIDADLGRSKGDVEFMMARASTLPQVDLARVALMGHSFGGIAALSVAMRNGLIDGVVTLDSTLDNAAIKDLPLAEGDWQIFRQGDRLVAPALVFAGKEAPFHLVRTFRRAERHLVRLPGLDHNSFIWHGVAKAQLENREEAPGRLGAYRDIMRLTLTFLDAKVKRAPSEVAPLARPEGAEHAEVEYLPPSTRPLEPTALAAGVVKRGGDDGLAWLEAVVRAEKVPANVLKQVVTALEERRHHGAAAAVATLNVRIHPESFAAYQSLGDALAAGRRWNDAASAYSDALEVLEKAKVDPAAAKARLRGILTGKRDVARRRLEQEESRDATQGAR